MAQPHAVLEAVLAGDVNQLYAAIFADCDVNLANDVRNAPLHAACFLNSLPCATLLVRAGANVSARNDRAQTPLHFAAASSSDSSLISLLLQAGADPLAKDHRGLTPRDLAKCPAAVEALDACLFAEWNRFLVHDAEQEQQPVAGSCFTPPRTSPRAALSGPPNAVDALLESLSAIRQADAARGPERSPLGAFAPDSSLQVDLAQIDALRVFSAGSPKALDAHSGPQSPRAESSPPTEAGTGARGGLNGFFVVVDGASVFVSTPAFESLPAPSMVSPAADRESQEAAPAAGAGAAAAGAPALDPDVILAERFVSVKRDSKEQGLGMLIREDGLDGFPVIVRIRRGSKAFDAGLVVGDRLMSVDGHPVRGLAIDDVTAQLRASLGAVLQIERPVLRICQLCRAGVDWESGNESVLHKLVQALSGQAAVALTADDFALVLRSFQAGVGWLRQGIQSKRADEHFRAMRRAAAQSLRADSEEAEDLVQASVLVIDDALARIEAGAETDVDEDVTDSLADAWRGVIG